MMESEVMLILRVQLECIQGFEMVGLLFGRCFTEKL